MSLSSKPLRILIAALGGQGGGVLAEWLVEAGTRAGFAAQSTSIPGVAQRTGATTYYVEIFPVPLRDLDGARPVLGLYPVPGAIDLVVASELLEAGRVMQAGMVSPERTRVITSTSRTLTTAEKLSLGDGRFSSERLLAVLRANSRTLTAFDMEACAASAGTVVSAVMLGAIASSGVLPIARDVFEGVIRESDVGVEASLRGFAAGFAPGAAAAPDRGAGAMQKEAAATMPRRENGEAPFAKAPPESADAIIALGCERLREFQDERYVALYRERLERVRAAERAADPHRRHGEALTRETARFLALWMAFDDIVRVARLKLRASRFERVRAEVKAAPRDVVRVIDHFKPGIPEFAGLLPAGLARGLLAWDTKRQARGRAPWAFPLHLPTHTISGALLLRFLASLRMLRRRGLRYAEEQRDIERWLAAITDAARADWQLAYEIALCGRLVKGYGETNVRGKRNLAHVLEHLVGADAPAAMRATRVREAREAALTDEAGAALDAALVKHGAPPRPVLAQPIRWMPRPQGAAGSARGHSTTIGAP
jgi:indolepyruvate ferredoxin oxidoreductase beta subunit